MAISDAVHPPQLWPADHKQRRATWMELFFDLIFVAAVAEIGKSLSADFSLTGLFRYSFLFVLIWWAWSGHTLFTTRFDSDDLVQRSFILLQSFIAAVMAANARDALDSRSSAGFGAAYAGMRLILVGQYLRARHIPQTRDLTTRFAAGFGIAAAVWIASAFTEAPVRYWLWTFALFIDFLTPWLAERHGLNAPPHAEHYPERFGLFTIILLGEFVTEVMRGIASHEYWSPSAAITAFAGIAFVFSLWWWYFDRADGAGERHVRSRREQRIFSLWSYSHLPLFISIGVAGVGFKHLIALQDGEHLHHAEGVILFLAVAVSMIALATIGASSNRALALWALAKRVSPQYLIAVGMLVTGFYAVHAHKALLAGLLVASCLGQGFLAGRKATAAKQSTLSSPGAASALPNSQSA
jgi:low temperature requirement protein LtrA